MEHLLVGVVDEKERLRDHGENVLHLNLADGLPDLRQVQRQLRLVQTQTDAQQQEGKEGVHGKRAYLLRALEAFLSDLVGHVEAHLGNQKCEGRLKFPLGRHREQNEAVNDLERASNEQVRFEAQVEHDGLQAGGELRDDDEGTDCVDPLDFRVGKKGDQDGGTIRQTEYSQVCRR